MSRVLLALVALLALSPLVSCASLRAEFDGAVAAIGQFAALLEAHAADQADTDASLAAMGASLHEGEESDASLLEASAEAEAEPTYSLPYPAVGGPALFHPYSSINPLSVGAVPPVQVVSAAAFAASPLSSYYAAAVGAHNAAALGVAPAAYYPAAAAWGGDAAAKGGYNRHGLTAGWVGYHPGLSRDLRMLGGKGQRGAAAGAKASLMEMGASAETEASTQSELEQAALEAEAALDADLSALMQLGAEVQAEAEAQTETETEAEAETDPESEAAAEIDIEFEPQQLLEAGAEQVPAAAAANAGAAKPANPTYVLPYPPVLPGHYTPLFNPYTNVNPLSTPFANVAAQPGAHPGVAAAAAAQAASLASVSGHIAGAAGGYPMYPFAAAAAVDAPVAAAALAGNPVPFSGYAGWIHPQQLNSAPVGDNANAKSLGQFLELHTEVDSEHCVGCEFN